MHFLMLNYFKSFQKFSNPESIFTLIGRAIKKKNNKQTKRCCSSVSLHIKLFTNHFSNPAQESKLYHKTKLHIMKKHNWVTLFLLCL